MQVCRAYPDRVVIFFAGLPVSFVEFESGKKRLVVILLTTWTMSGIGQNEAFSSNALERPIPHRNRGGFTFLNSPYHEPSLIPGILSLLSFGVSPVPDLSLIHI